MLGSINCVPKANLFYLSILKIIPKVTYIIHTQYYAQNYFQNLRRVAG